MCSFVLQQAGKDHMFLAFLGAHNAVPWVAKRDQLKQQVSMPDFVLRAESRRPRLPAGRASQVKGLFAVGGS